MWVFTQNGFISAVRVETGSKIFKVRARDRKALHDLAIYADVEIIATPFADYPYRLFVDELIFGGYLLHELDEAKYINYKSRIAKTRGYTYAAACSAVWSVMHDVEDESARTT